MDFTDRVAIVTGAGGGLGRAYALALAARGAKLVVNDRGGAPDGSGGSAAAERVADEIVAAGGTAIASAADVSHPGEVEAMVAGAEARLGGIDILICNAGILRDRSFARMDMADFRAVLDVHLIGSAQCAKAVWEGMRARGRGRILMTSSSSGLYGNFGQSNYAAAKLGIAGLARTLHLEGAKYDIRVNCIAPTAMTRMTEGLLPPGAGALFDPEAVVPGALFLVSDEAPSGAILAAGGGVFQAAHITLTRGIALPEAERTPEGVAARWNLIADRAGETVPAQGAEQAMGIVQRLHGD